MSKLIPTKKNVKTVTDLRENTMAVFASLKDEGPQYIFQHSEPKAVMLSNNEYQGLLDQIEDLEDALLAQSLEREVLSTPANDFIPLDVLLKQYE